MLALLFLLPVTGCATAGPGAPPAAASAADEPGAATVGRVVDGDTIVAVLAGAEQTVRLIGIDTPETKKPGTAVECYGEQASQRLHELLPDGTPVRLERDVEPFDRYDRLLAYVYRRADGLFVNHAMVADGYAGPLTIPPNVAHRDTFTAAARQAREAGLRLWSSCGGPHEARAKAGGRAGLP